MHKDMHYLGRREGGQKSINLSTISRSDIIHLTINVPICYTKHVISYSHPHEFFL